MGLTYFKRYRMEVDLCGRAGVPPLLPEGYRLVSWQPDLLEAHAEAKYYSFRGEIDANVFPCLGDQEGCLRLMGEISRKTGFLADATWLLVHSRTTPLGRRSLAAGQSRQTVEYCGTIQGVRDRMGLGAVQNVGILPEHRGRGLGSCLMFAAMNGFRRIGLRRAFLEVTAQNEGAVRLYRRLGFVKVRTIYKAVDIAPVTA